MRIGCPKEIKNHEYRVGLTPAAVREYVAHGHAVGARADPGALAVERQGQVSGRHPVKDQRVVLPAADRRAAGGGFVTVPIITVVDADLGADTARVAAATSALVMLVGALALTLSLVTSVVLRLRAAGKRKNGRRGAGRGHKFYSKHRTLPGSFLCVR